MSDNEALSVTFKSGKGFEDTWAVFRGTLFNIRKDIEEYFGLETDEDQTLHEVVMMATATVHGSNSIAKNLGGRVVRSTKSESVTEETPAAAEPAESPNADLIERLLAAESAEALKTLWAKNKGAFDDAEVKAAYGKRGKELKKSG